MAIVGVLAALWSASGYVGAFTEASNSIYEVEEGRPVWKKKPLQILITFVCIMLVAITALALVLTGPLAEARRRRASASATPRSRSGSSRSGRSCSASSW